MGSRSNITLVGNPTQGENIGISSGATGVYVGKVDSTLQFKSICGAGTVSIITGTTTITISGTSGGGGSISDGKNGLSKSGTNIVLGGALTGDTTIILNGKIFNISGTTGTAMIVDGVSDIIALQSAGDAFIDVDGINDVINIASSGAVVFLSGTTLFLSGTTITLDSANIILYGAIMFGTIPNAGTCLNSVLVWDSGTGEVKIVPYVSGTTVNVPITGATNGLSVTDKQIKLGGSLTGDTLITAGGNDFAVCGINANLRILPSGGYLSGGTLELRHSGTKKITLDTLGFAIEGPSKFYSATEYDSDFSPFTALQIPDAQWVTGLTSAINVPVTGATNLGSGNGTIYTTTSNKKLQLKTLTGGTNVNLTCNGNYIIINANDVSGIEWSGSTANSIGTYIDANTICSQPNLTFDGTKLNITGNLYATSCVCSPIISGETIYASTCFCGTVNCAVDSDTLDGQHGSYYAIKANAITGATNLGSGNGTICAGISGNKIQLKSLSGGTNITLTCNGNYIGINTPTVSVPITGACNGLSVVNKNVVLGGTLTGHTLIDANSKDFCVGCARNIMLASTVGGYNVTLSGYNTYICGTNTLSICGQQLSVCDCAITPRGFRYSGNYRANFLCDSLVDAAYVTGKTSVINVPVTGATNLGSGNGIIYTTTSNKNLQLKTLSGGTNVTLTCNGNYIAINVADTEAAFGWSNLAKGSTVAGCGTQASGATLCNNTYYGVSAGTHTTSGSNNVGIGFSALHNNTIGNTNIAIGTSALLNNTGGTNNIAIGCEALCTNCCGGNNVANGYKALNSNTIGSYNFAVGCTALNSNISGCHNIAFGGQSLFSNNTASFNIALGYQTLLFNTVGNCNIAIGRQALTTNCSGSDNIAFGSSALHDNTTGSNNFAAGNTALNCNTTGCNNIAIGISALLYNKTTSNNIALGCQALYCNTGGTNNIAIGTCALCCNCNGIDNIALGSCALRNNTIGNCNIAVGCTTLTLNTTGCDNIAIGWSVLANNTTSSGNIGLGQRALNSNSTGSNNIAIGHQTLFSNTVSNNIAIGFQALRPNTTGTDNIGMGYFALRCNCIGSCNIAIGTQALWGNKSNNNIALGFCALSNITGGTNNIAIGFQALSFGACCGSYNIANGNQALYNNTLGCYNIANGYQALYNNRTGNCNVGIGTCTLFANSGGTNNIAIGRCAGFYETGSNKLYVANCASCSLIYGEFDNKRLVISGTTEIVNPVVSGACNYLYLGDKDTDGSWRFAVSGASMIIQRRVTGAYVTKQTIT